MKIPIYRAKKIDSDEYVIGFYSSAYDIHHYVITHLGVDTKTSIVYQMSTDIHKIDPTTLAIHFPNMLDSQGNKIFASLSKDGKGGDIVISKSYPFYGDAPEITDSNGKCKELNYNGLLLFTSTGCYINYIKVVILWPLPTG